MKLQTDLREFVALLVSRKVEFIVVGFHALAHHGHPRFTGDIDSWVRSQRRSMCLLRACLSRTAVSVIRHVQPHGCGKLARCLGCQAPLPSSL